MFHSRARDYYAKAKQLDFLADEVMPYYSVDTAAVHLRGFFASIAATYVSPFMLPILCISCLDHMTSMYIFLTRLNEIKRTKKSLIDGDPAVLEQMNTFSWLTSMPMMFDIAVVAYFSTLPMADVNLFYITYVIALVLQITPFYDMSHVAFHLLLIAQNVLITWSNLR
jgi:hypothetical protein